MTEITYQLREEDIIAFVEHHWANSPTVRRSKWISWLSFLIVWLGVGYFFWFLEKDTGLIITLVITGIISAFFMPSVYRDRRRKITLKMYREGKNLALFKPISLQIDEIGLGAEAASGSSNVHWEYIERLDASADYLFLYTNAVNAIIVPKTGVVAGDFDSFAVAAQKYWHDAKSAAKVNDPQ
jgi:hypothetical protein